MRGIQGTCMSSTYCEGASFAFIYFLLKSKNSSAYFCTREGKRRMKMRRGMRRIGRETAELEGWITHTFTSEGLSDFTSVWQVLCFLKAKRSHPHI